MPIDSIVASSFWEATVPDQTSATLQSKQLNGTFHSYSIRRVKLRPLGWAEQQMRGASLAKGEQILEVWQEALSDARALGSATLPCPLPKPSDRWVVAGQTYVVVPAKGTQKGLLDQRINCHVQLMVGSGATL